MTPDTTHRPGTREDLELSLRALEQRCAELEERERRQSLLANAVHEIIMVASPGGAVEYLNDHAVQYAGVPREELLGGNWEQVIHPDDLPALARVRSTSAAAGRDFEFKARLRRHDGAYRWHINRMVPVLEGGKVKSWVGTAADVHELVEVERALRQSEMRFKLMAEVIPQLVWLALPNGNVDFYNSRWSDYTGLSLEEGRGSGWEKTVHPEDIAPTLMAWRRSTQLGIPYSVEQRLRGRDGRYRWFLSQALPLTDETGQVVRWYGTCTDIEDQKRLQDESRRSSERLEIALEAGRMGAWELDVASGTVSWTSSLAIVYGLDPNQTNGPISTLEKFVHPEDLESVRTTVRGAIANIEPFRFEFRIIRPDGSTRWLEARGRVMGSGGRAVRAMGVSVDITDRKEIDKELARRAEELVRSNKELEQFAFVASHDLKEPLRKIAGYAELIQSRYQSKLDEKGERFLNYLQDGVKRMDAIIGDLLAYSRAGRSGQKREAVDTAELVKEVLDDLESALVESKATVHVKDLPPIYANRTQIRLLFQNLIANGLKFHGPNPPDITVSAEREAEHWRFAVKDNGIGIDPQYHERIFEIFQRLHTRAEYPGTGIGLAICKKIVETYGGRIWLESKLGAGSTFFFTLPAF
jgi:PAS domain S-box-containing protein